jgi:hypothetical protein
MGLLRDRTSLFAILSRGFFICSGVLMSTGTFIKCQNNESLVGKQLVTWKKWLLKRIETKEGRGLIENFRTL